MKSFQVIGHYLSLAPEHISSTTISDGTLFRTKHDAERYAAEKMHPGATVKEHESEDPKFNIPREFSARRAIVATFKGRKNIVTEINGTVKNIREYYMENTFDIGHCPAENMQRCKGVEFLDFS